MSDEVEKYIQCGHYEHSKCTIGADAVIEHRETLGCDPEVCVITVSKGILSCEHNPVMVPCKIKITDEGIKHLKGNLMYWLKKPQFEKVIAELFALPEEERNKMIDQSLREIEKVENGENDDL